MGIINNINNNNALKTNYIKAKLDGTQQNSKCWFCEDRNKIINTIIRRLAQKECNSWHDWLGKLIHQKLYNGKSTNQICS